MPEPSDYGLRPNSLPHADFSPFGGYPASSFPLYIEDKEPDDYLHNPDPVLDEEYDKNRFLYDLKTMDSRAMAGLISFVVLFVAAMALFVLFPVLTFSGILNTHEPESYEVLTHYHYPLLSAIRTSLVDPDTPAEARVRDSQRGEPWELVFSDEFNAEGRTFYEGDDQFFTAPDLHYDATKDLEWYDPDAVTTAGGTLNLRMDAFKNHNLFYRSGMVQSWNKFCFTEGIIEISARLPHYGNISGLWPGLWTMGNLGRPGYLASTEGVWPYTYDLCDAGITPNQSDPDGISYLPGQRLNSCTCKGEAHPNPGVGRGAPEVDALEGEVSNGNGRVSQSLQVAPYDIWYMPDYDFIQIHNNSVTTMNTYTGGPFQQAVSATTTLNTTWYERGNYTHNFQRYGFEYLNDDESGYLTWFVGLDPTMTIRSTALHPNGNVGWRKLPKEPMSIIMNLGISNNWAYIDWPALIFPATMRVDYVRVYQPPGQTKVGCDPDDYPTYNYIQEHLNIYQNVNLTTFSAGGYKFPKNKLTGC
ncbi:glycoside hydrolase family 16 protein [Suhomyces tanzawaensis NRRL Y-17324]|uniref:Glycoside hydrolase family 16 protein n=1 Tax=Suhomyces tanzawaensis NRRL Y-17324 TaxID=984487 RepID=A0A1E4SI94_9ASCO|nr:glycoside hydrolase family 16 protein [Suhomyces tanzawaensis NRRL Y-17324]ODV79226.1 glycoside hydrolase family 16 protein [Suhomyces tanzawaensis NRRL Y-17324]